MRPRLLILVVSYNAERTTRNVLSRIPVRLAADFEVEILLIDDASSDRTFQEALAYRRSGRCPFPLTVLSNPVNQGYGGNQKIGYAYAMRHDFDIVALLHGDGQYAPELLPELASEMLREKADAVFGSRFLAGSHPLKGGMPMYKYIGNRILSSYQNAVLGTNLSEFHSGYRLYRVDALRVIPIELNTNDFHFDTEIIIQLLRSEFKIRELGIPTYYGEEICYVNGMRYALNVVTTTTIARLMDLGLLHRGNFDLSDRSRPRYESKLSFDSSHSAAIDLVPEGAHVLDIGCAAGTLGPALEGKGCRVTGLDGFSWDGGEAPNACYEHDLATNRLPVDLEPYSHVLLLDVVEHLPDPEAFVASLKEACRSRYDLELIVTTGNVAFFVVRLMLALGSFNYGRRGILDYTHKRLFTFSSFRRLFEERGFRIEEVRGIPAPYPLALGDTGPARLLTRLNRALIRLSRGLFSYQILMRVRPYPSIDSLLNQTISASDERSRHAEANGPVVGGQDTDR